VKPCRKPHFLTAKAGYSARLNGSRFRLKRTRLRLPPGRYTVIVKATDASRNVEAAHARDVRVR
jgi:hypothetical protein